MYAAVYFATVGQAETIDEPAPARHVSMSLKRNG